MSEPINMTEGQLTAGFFKLAILLGFIVTVFGTVASVVADRYQSIATNSLLFCVAFFFLSNGFLCVLHIVDWFEARKAKRNG